jgi:hypothetical protein
VEDFARRNPAVFLGGAFALGLVGARFIKSSGHRAERERWERGEVGEHRPGGKGWEREEFRGQPRGAEGAAGRTGMGGYGVGEPGRQGV